MCRFYLRQIFAVLSLLLVLQSCEPDTYITYMVDMASADGRMSLNLDIRDDYGTKASLLAGAEQISSGAMVCVMLHSSGKMDSVQSIQPDGVTSIDVPVGRAIDLYVLGNLWALDADGNAVSLDKALGVDFPADREDLESMAYLLDGGELAPGWRREELKDVARLGIPYAGLLEDVKVKPGETIRMTCSRLFSRVTLTVDHTGLDGAQNDDWFVNGSVRMRQANGRLSPFSNLPQRALSVSDMVEGDYDVEMENAHCMSFTFYVPENMQGTLLPANTDPGSKSFDQVVAAVGEQRASLLTYVEFRGSISKDAGGYGGDVVYRFYLGADNCSNFDLQRGRDYDVRLGFRVNSIFDPWWQVNVDGALDDSRTFCITSDAAFSRALPDGQMIAVRKSRPGRAYVYMNQRGEMGDNQLCGCPVADPDVRISDLSDHAWTSDFLSASNAALDVPMRSELARLGIEASFDASSAALEFRVVDPSRFVAGEDLELSLRLLPGKRTVRIRLRTYEDMSVSWDKSPSEGFFMGMARTANLIGYSGEVLLSSSKAGVLKTSASESEPFMTPDSPLKIGSDNPVRLYGWRESDGEFDVNITPVDSFNDGDAASTARLRLDKPYLFLLAPALEVLICTSGNLEDVDAVYCRRDELSDDSMIRLNEFDETLYWQIMDYGYQFGTDPTQDEVDAFEGTFKTVRNRTTYTSGGYRRTWICRKALSPSVSPNCIPAEAKGRPKSYEIRAVSKSGIVSSNSRTLLLLPLLNSMFSASFAPSYHDFSLMDTRYLDEPYRSYQTNFIADGQEQIFENQPYEYLEAYAIPLESGSEGYAEGVSESMKVEFDNVFPAGQINLRFVDDGVSTRHSVGLHEIRIVVTNRHSRERMEAVLGQVKVYVDFVVGLDLKMDYQTRDQVSFTVWPVLVSAIRRTSCAGWFSSFGVTVDDAGPTELVYDVFNHQGNDWINVARGSKVYSGASYAHYEEPFYNLYSVLLEREPGYEGEGLDDIDEDSFAEHFSGGIWLNDIGGNPQKSVNVVVYGMKDDAAGGVGYYCFHRLQDLCQSTKGWVRRYGE